MHRAIVEELVNIVLVTQESERNGFTEKPEMQADLAIIRTNFITNAAISDHLASSPPSESAIKAEYQNHYANTLATQYRARHILLKSDRQASDMVDELEEGANFALLAEKHSIDPSADQGGDLGWFLPEQMVPSFAAAVARLEKGQYTDKPIRTQFGWHVIKLEDQRQVPPPPLEQVREQLVSQIQKRQVNEFINALRCAPRRMWRSRSSSPLLLGQGPQHMSPRHPPARDHMPGLYPGGNVAPDPFGLQIPHEHMKALGIEHQLLQAAAHLG